MLCQEMEVKFTSLHDAFHLRDNTVNYGYLCPDNVHITQRAAECVIKRIGLRVLAGRTGVSRDPTHLQPLTRQTPGNKQGYKKQRGPGNSHI